MKKLNRQSIMTTPDRKLVEVEVPEWDGIVYLKSMSIKEGFDLEEAKKAVPQEKVVPLYLAHTMVDEHGSPLFTGPEAVDLLCEKNPEVLLRLFYRALELNDGDKPKKKGEGEDEEKKSSPAPSDEKPSS